MAGFYYRDVGVGAAGQDENTQLRLRTEQMRRALREASGLHSADVSTTRPAPAVSGELLDDGDTGGDTARLIDQDVSGEAQAGAAPGGPGYSGKGRRMGKRRPGSRRD